MRKSEKIYDALSCIDDDIISECEDRYASAKSKNSKRKRSTRIIAVAAVLAALSAAVAGTFAASRRAQPVTDDPDTDYTAYLPESTDSAPETEPRDTVTGQDQPVLIEDGKPFSYFAGLPELTGDSLSDYKNRMSFRVTGLSGVYDKLAAAMINAGMDVVSPVNVYTALSMLAECADGGSRAQILGLLGAPDMETLRENGKNVWRSLYREDEFGSTVSASSLWLDSSLAVRQECVEKLVADHFASVSAGDFSSDEYKDQIRKWLSDNTRGLLDEQIRDLTFDNARAVLSSTLYMKATWDNKFGKETVKRSFDGKKTCAFMFDKSEDRVYFEDGFTAYRRDLGGKAGAVWFFLPDEGNSAKNVIDSGVISYINGKKSDPELCILNLRIPEFDVSADSDITDTLRALGVTECFGENADLTNLTYDPLKVSEIRHAARLTADTKGIEGAAYTVIVAPTAADPWGLREIDLFFDRPFAFAVVDAFGTPVFTGVIDSDSVK